MLYESSTQRYNQTSQHHSVSRFNVEDVQDLDPFFGSQDYSPAQGSSDLSVPVGDDFLAEEVAPFKKKTSKIQDVYNWRSRK
ncbi:hypothetical protein Tco_0300025 [Tanacetum coccineum]